MTAIRKIHEIPERTSTRVSAELADGRQIAIAYSTCTHWILDDKPQSGPPPDWLMADPGFADAYTQCNEEHTARCRAVAYNEIYRTAGLR